MKRSLLITLGILICLVLAAGAYFLATGMMDSLYAYRSPLHSHPPAPGQPLGQPDTRRVVFVLIDALRYDTSLKKDVMPFLNELRQQAAVATMHSRPPSYSEPGYTVLLTGAWPDISDGPAMNLDYAQIPTFTQDDLFSAAHRAGLKTAVSGYNWFEKLIPQSSVDSSFYTPGEDQAADRQVVDAALPWLKDGSYQLTLIHIDQVDFAGHHEGGPRDPRWDAAAHRSDDLLRQIAATLNLSKDTLLVVSDHGQIDQGGHGGQDPIVLVEPFVLAGAGVKPGDYGNVSMVDVAPTLAALLGANIPASSQGHVRTEMLKLASEKLPAIQSQLETQQNQLVKEYQVAIGRTVDLQPGADTVAAHQAAMDAARSNRIVSERSQRTNFAFAGLLIPLLVLFLYKWRTILWLLGGGLLYVALFNLRYAVLDKRTYSLSSVTGATDLILYCAITAAVALLIAWLAVMLAMRAFRGGAGQAAGLSIGLALVTIYLLALPVLWSYWVNGILITWTLPDFASFFLAFLSVTQILIVAVLGLVLTGIGALVGRLAAR